MEVISRPRPPPPQHNTRRNLGPPRLCFIQKLIGESPRKYPCFSVASLEYKNNFVIQTSISFKIIIKPLKLFSKTPTLHFWHATNGRWNVSERFAERKRYTVSCLLRIESIEFKSLQLIDDVFTMENEIAHMRLWASPITLENVNRMNSVNLLEEKL